MSSSTALVVGSAAPANDDLILISMEGERFPLLRRCGEMSGMLRQLLEGSDDGERGGGG
jgi:hypothetical protein